uniref:Uncharacterized protein n=1 Tax=Oryza sativa subsp. japonica TaxID=39947 RepID=Q6ZLL5_ORYSJ|nr:hypothetical protein [Oryza sativa Japonica Group]BAD30605.1 hypothetical protein [Oryza sativa Japonica Group]
MACASYARRDGTDPNHPLRSSSTQLHSTLRSLCHPLGPTHEPVGPTPHTQTDRKTRLAHFGLLSFVFFLLYSTPLHSSW